jgi:hypothetical protein
VCLYETMKQAEQYKLGNIVTLRQMQNARSGFDDFDVFCTAFLSNVIGKQAYNKKVVQETISIIATVSDEAFVILCLENSLEQWEQEARNPTAKRIDAVYTASPAEASKYSGWSKEGMRRFNTLQREIIPDLRKNTMKLEVDYLMHQKGIKLPSRKKKKAKLPGDREDLPWSNYTNDDDELHASSQEENIDHCNERGEGWRVDREELEAARNGPVYQG